MDRKEIIDLIEGNGVCYLATVDGDQPRVRTFMVWKADESGIYFDTADYKEVYKQIKDNPKIEACFHLRDEKKMLRISGEVEFVNKPEIKAEFFGDKEDNPHTVFFRLTSGNAILWFRNQEGKSQTKKSDF